MNLPIQTDGDGGWFGFASRPDPSLLQPGLAKLARNKRFVRGRAETRLGLRRVADDINPGTAPLTLPFSLAPDVAVTSITRTSSTATVTTATAHGYTNGQTINIRGAAETEYNGDFAITVTDTDEFTYTISGTPATPATGTIYANGGPVVRTSYSGGLFGACAFRSPNFAAGVECIALAGSDALWIWYHGASAVSKNYPAGHTVEETDRIKLLQCFDRLYLFREAAMTGIYAPQTLGTGALTSSAGTATVALTAHGFANGQRVKIEGAAQAAYNIEVDITKINDDSFSFPVSHSPATPATGTITVRAVKAPLYWDGVAAALAAAPGGSHSAGATYSTMPSSSVAAYWQNQLVICPTPTRDIVQVSDVLDPDTFDPFLKSFRPNAGTSDYIVAIHPYAESDLLIFMRKSIYRARIGIASNGTDIDPATSFIELITDEIGCSARDTIVTAGQWIYFLSDAGVYRLDSNFSDLKLRGNTMPLSDAIADQFEDINADAVHTANAIWFDNRYWLAVPTGENDFPDTLLIYNALNEQWESRDNYPTGIHSLVIGTYASTRTLFGATRAGRLFVLNHRADGDDPNDPSVTDVVQIEGRLESRRYTFGSVLPKRFLRAIAGIVLEDASAISVSSRLLEPDREITVGTLQHSDGVGPEDFSGKFSIRQRGSGIEMVFADTAGRSTIRSLAVEAVLSDPRATTLTEK